MGLLDLSPNSYKLRLRPSGGQNKGPTGLTGFILSQIVLVRHVYGYINTRGDF